LQGPEDTLVTVRNNSLHSLTIPPVRAPSWVSWRWEGQPISLGTSVVLRAGETRGARISVGAARPIAAETTLVLWEKGTLKKEIGLVSRQNPFVFHATWITLATVGLISVWLSTWGALACWGSSFVWLTTALWFSPRWLDLARPSLLNAFWGRIPRETQLGRYLQILRDDPALSFSVGDLLPLAITAALALCLAVGEIGLHGTGFEVAVHLAIIIAATNVWASVRGFNPLAKLWGVFANRRTPPKNRRASTIRAAD
jgi:hypothetical protein